MVRDALLIHSRRRDPQAPRLRLVRGALVQLAQIPNGLLVIDERLGRLWPCVRASFVPMKKRIQSGCCATTWPMRISPCVVVSPGAALIATETPRAVKS